MSPSGPPERQGAPPEDELAALRRRVAELEHELDRAPVSTPGPGVTLEEHRAARAALERSNARFDELVRRIPSGVYVFRFRADRSMAFEYVSPRFCAILGVDEAAVMADASVAFGAVHPDDAEQLGRENLDAGLHGVPFQWEGRFVVHGDTRWVRIASEPTLEPNGDSVWNGVVSDVTARQRAELALREKEERLERVIDGTGVGLWDWNVQTGETVYNERWAEILGYTLAELAPLSIATWKSLCHPDDLPRSDACLARHFAGETASYDCECRMRHKSGAWVWVHDRGKVSSRDAAGRPLRMAGTHADITARKRAEERLRDKTAELEELTRTLERKVEAEVALRYRGEQLLIEQSKLAAMGEMVGAIAHQWRQPLNALALVVQNLEDAHRFGELDDPYLASAVARAMAQIQHMSRTIDDFRAFFRPDREPTVFGAMQAVAEVLKLLSAQLLANDIRFRIVCHAHGRSFESVEGVPACDSTLVRGPKNEFEHVLLNLVDNAREAIVTRRRERGDERPGHIRFDFRHAADRISIRVHDDGCGFDAANLDRVFEPFFTTKGAKGTGLGLYMSKVIIEEHMRGTIAAERDGEGATVAIELPAARPEAP
ncbi:MAG: PAS domain-containing protein [Polyangiaceae bacterium]|nr:PAS domain-containing protein [Polyangiaceae bacterium]